VLTIIYIIYAVVTYIAYTAVFHCYLGNGYIAIDVNHFSASSDPNRGVHFIYVYIYIYIYNIQLEICI